MNKKGFTLVELIVSFLLISTIAIFLFQIVTIISSIYSDEGIRTELVLEQSNISNIINKDIYTNEKNGNYVKRVIVVNDNQINIKYKDGSSKTLYINRNKNTISYGKFTQKFLAGTTIGNIDVDIDYVNNATFKYNGVSTIKIPISYANINNTFDILTVIRFDSKEYAINLEDDTPEYVVYRKYNDGTPVYFNVTTGLECTEQEQIANYTNNSVASGLNSGCMKFYAFLDSDTLGTLNLILDHNVTLAANRPNTLTAFKTATDSWTGVLAPDNYRQSFFDADNNTATLYTNWGSDGYKARFISANEIAKITGRSSFDSTQTLNTGYFYLDGASGSDPNWQTQIANSVTKSDFAWLYDYITDSPTYGANIDSASPNLTNGYWTADKTVGTYYFYWVINKEGKLLPDGDGNNQGSRPVIKILKSKLSQS